MSVSASVAPPNSLLFIASEADDQVPVSMNRGLVAATDSALAIGTAYEGEGETTIELAAGDDPVAPNDASLWLAFDGPIRFKSDEVCVMTVEWVKVLRFALPPSTDNSPRRVRVWVNHKTEPDRICVRFDPGARSRQPLWVRIAQRLLRLRGSD